MEKHFLLTLLLITSFTLFSQTQKLDSVVLDQYVGFAFPAKYKFFDDEGLIQYMAQVDSQVVTVSNLQSLNANVQDKEGLLKLYKYCLLSIEESCDDAVPFFTDTTTVQGLTCKMATYSGTIDGMSLLIEVLFIYAKGNLYTFKLFTPNSLRAYENPNPPKLKFGDIFNAVRITSLKPGDQLFRN